MGTFCQRVKLVTTIVMNCYDDSNDDDALVGHAKQDDHQNDDGNDYDDPNDDDARFDYGQDGARALED